MPNATMTQSREEQNARLYGLLRRPIITEKTTELAELNQYVFEVDRSANKLELRRAFELAFPGRKVSAVRLIKQPGKSKRRLTARRPVMSKSWRKAIFSVEGEPIELFTEV